MLTNKFYKVGQNGGTYVTALFYNPITNETKSCCVRDYEYEDCSRDNDDLYYMSIDKEAQKAYYNSIGYICVSDTVKVVRGRKVPQGTIGVVTKRYFWYDRYHRPQAEYLILDDKIKVLASNCELI